MGTSRAVVPEECDLLRAAHGYALARFAGTLRALQTAYNRFNRWSRRGIWKRLFDELASKSRDSLYLIDSTIVKAHRSASGAKGGRKIRRSASAGAGERRKSTQSSTAKVAR